MYWDVIGFQYFCKHPISNKIVLITKQYLLITVIFQILLKHFFKRRFDLGIWST